MTHYKFQFFNEGTGDTDGFEEMETIGGPIAKVIYVYVKIGTFNLITFKLISAAE